MRFQTFRIDIYAYSSILMREKEKIDTMTKLKVRERAKKRENDETENELATTNRSESTQNDNFQDWKSVLASFIAEIELSVIRKSIEDSFRLKRLANDPWSEDLRQKSRASEAVRVKLIFSTTESALVSLASMVFPAWQALIVYMATVASSKLPSSHTSRYAPIIEYKPDSNNDPKTKKLRLAPSTATVTHLQDEKTSLLAENFRRNLKKRNRDADRAKNHQQQPAKTSESDTLPRRETEPDTVFVEKSSYPSTEHVPDNSDWKPRNELKHRSKKAKALHRENKSILDRMNQAKTQSITSKEVEPTAKRSTFTLKRKIGSNQPPSIDRPPDTTCIPDGRNPREQTSVATIPPQLSDPVTLPGRLQTTKVKYSETRADLQPKPSTHSRTLPYQVVTDEKIPVQADLHHQYLGKRQSNECPTLREEAVLNLTSEPTSSARWKSNPPTTLDALQNGIDRSAARHLQSPMEIERRPRNMAAQRPAPVLNKGCPPPLLCSETFLESLSSIVSQLGCGSWADSFSTSSSEDTMSLLDFHKASTGMEFDIVDTHLLTSSQIEFPSRCVGIVHQLSRLKSDLYVKEAMAQLTGLAASGKYRKVFIFFVQDTADSAVSMKNLVFLQTATFTDPGALQSSFIFRFSTPATVSGLIAATFFSVLRESQAVKSELYDVGTSTANSANFLLSIVPCLTVTGALQCVNLGENLFGILKSEPSFRQAIMQAIKGRDARVSEIHPLAMIQLTQALRVRVSQNILRHRVRRTSRDRPML